MASNLFNWFVSRSLGSSPAIISGPQLLCFVSDSHLMAFCILWLQFTISTCPSDLIILFSIVGPRRVSPLVQISSRLFTLCLCTSLPPSSDHTHFTPEGQRSPGFLPMPRPLSVLKIPRPISILLQTHLKCPLLVLPQILPPIYNACATSSHLHLNIMLS